MGNGAGDPLRTAMRTLHGKTLTYQILGKQFAQGHVVIDQQYLFHCTIYSDLFNAWLPAFERPDLHFFALACITYHSIDALAHMLAAQVIHRS